MSFKAAQFNSVKGVCLFCYGHRRRSVRPGHAARRTDSPYPVVPPPTGPPEGYDRLQTVQPTLQRDRALVSTTQT